MASFVPRNHIYFRPEREVVFADGTDIVTVKSCCICCGCQALRVGEREVILAPSDGERIIHRKEAL